jgi:hypothetical protein
MMMSHELLAKESTNDIEALYSSSYTETTRVEEVFIGDVYREVEASSDDELIETLAPDATEDPFGYTMPDVKMDQDDVDEFDGSSPTITPSDDDLGSSLETTPRHFSDHTEAAQPPIEPSADPAAHEAPISSAKKEQAFFANEISEEVIDRIVDRVMEKLSDSVVREVAMREVPRIASCWPERAGMHSKNAGTFPDSVQVFSSSLWSCPKPTTRRQQNRGIMNVGSVSVVFVPRSMKTKMPILFRSSYRRQMSRDRFTWDTPCSIR